MTRREEKRVYTATLMLLVTPPPKRHCVGACVLLAPPLLREVEVDFSRKLVLVDDRGQVRGWRHSACPKSATGPGRGRTRSGRGSRRAGTIPWSVPSCILIPIAATLQSTNQGHCGFSRGALASRRPLRAGAGPEDRAGSVVAALQGRPTDIQN